MTEAKKENFELGRIIRNTKKMEEYFIKNNLDLNKNKIQGCTNVDGEDTNYIFSKRQELVINKILAVTTKSVVENDKYDHTDSSIARAKRIYSRKKENIKIISTLIPNGGLMVKYFKYVTKCGEIPSPKVTDKHIRNFIDKLRNAYHNAEVVYVDNKRMLLTPIEFRTAMEKLNIYDDIDHMVEDFQYVEFKEKETA